MMKKVNMFVAFATFLIFSASLWIAPEANAVPAFARQTGVACSTCHFQHFPALNAFGRAFKAGGYTQVGGQSLVEGDDLSIPATLNASLVTKVRYQKTDAKGNATGKAKGELQFPDEAALLIGGRAGEHVGFLLEANLKGNDANNYSDTNVFASFKMPIMYDVGGAKAGIIPFTTDAGGVSYGFELLNTGALRMQRVLEHRTETSAQQFIGTDGAAEGFAFVAYNETGFVNASLWGPAHGTVATDTDLSHYIRIATTPNIGGWDIGIGGQYWGGETKVGETIYVTDAWAADAQAQGNVGLPLGIYLSYGVAGKPKNDGKTYSFNAYATNKKEKTAWSVLAELGVLPGKVTLAAGYRSGDSGAAANNQEDAITGGASYLLAQNVQLQLNYTSYSGNARDKTVNATEAKTLTTLMLFAAF